MSVLTSKVGRYHEGNAHYGERNYTIRLRLGLVFITFPQGNRERNRDASNRYQAESNFSLTVYVGE
jgi:hypothetical protein